MRNNMSKASEILVKEFMEPALLTAEDLAFSSGLPLLTCEGLMDGTIPINRNAAEGLSKACENSVEFWLNLQKASEEPGSPRAVYDDYSLSMEFDEFTKLMEQTTANLKRMNAGQKHMRWQMGGDEALSRLYALRKELDEARTGWVASNCG
jgi:plasmid maintenance system antidote protein VapI